MKHWKRTALIVVAVIIVALAVLVLWPAELPRDLHDGEAQYPGTRR